jgi:hypothetical protein
MNTGELEEVTFYIDYSSVFLPIFDRIKAFNVRQVNVINYDTVRIESLLSGDSANSGRC